VAIDDIIKKVALNEYQYQRAFDNAQRSYENREPDWVDEPGPGSLDVDVMDCLMQIPIGKIVEGTQYDGGVRLLVRKYPLEQINVQVKEYNIAHPGQEIEPYDEEEMSLNMSEELPDALEKINLNFPSRGRVELVRNASDMMEFHVQIEPNEPDVDIPDDYDYDDKQDDYIN